MSEIAARAGVNKQLISYYFGGKEGLYQAIIDRWHEQEEQLAEPGISLAELACALPRGRAPPARPPAALHPREHGRRTPARSRMSPRPRSSQDLRARQAAGEIAQELDPAFVLLVLQAAVISGVVFPGDVKRLMGLDPASPEYLEHMDHQLRLLVGRLA